MTVKHAGVAFSRLDIGNDIIITFKVETVSTAGLLRTGRPGTVLVLAALEDVDVLRRPDLEKQISMHLLIKT